MSPKTPNAGPSMTKDASYVPAHDNKDGECSRTHQEADLIPQSKDSTPRRKQGPRYEYEFNGYCYFCSNFGHKAMDCRFYGRRRDGSPNDLVRCWTCNQFGHGAATCHTLRCYTCSGFGHKAQECASQRSQPRRSPSYHQQEYLNIRRQIPTIRDTLSYGDMKFIEEVLEVPTT